MKITVFKILSVVAIASLTRAKGALMVSLIPCRKPATDCRMVCMVPLS